MYDRSMTEPDFGKHLAQLFDVAGAAEKAFAGTGRRGTPTRSRASASKGKGKGGPGSAADGAQAQAKLVAALKNDGMPVKRQGFGDAAKNVPPSMEIGAQVGDLNEWIRRNGISEYVHAVDHPKTGLSVLVPKVRPGAWTMDDANTQLTNAGNQAISVQKGWTPVAEDRPNLSDIGSDADELQVDIDAVEQSFEKPVSEATAL